MYVSGSTTTIVNSIIRDNSAYYEGGMYVFSATVNLYATTFSSNSPDRSSYGPDIRNLGTVTVYRCAAGYYGGTRGAALETYGTIGGSPYSFSGCTACAR